MKILKLFFVGLISVNALLCMSNVLADPTSPETLPLTPKQIAKLQSLVSVSNNSVPNFQMAPPHEHIVWNQTPIDVTLPVGKERIVSFPTTIEFGYDKNALPDNVLRVQNANGTLYLLAKAEFSTQRVQVKCSDGQIILLDLMAKKEAGNTPIDVVMAQTQTALLPSLGNKENSSVTNDASPAALEAVFPDDTISYITLTRFAVTIVSCLC